MQTDAGLPRGCEREAAMKTHFTVIAVPLVARKENPVTLHGSVK